MNAPHSRILITESYRQLNAEKHRTSKAGFGKGGIDQIPMVRNICMVYGSLDVLDYGCGSALLSKNIDFPIRNYDPAIEMFSAMPDPADVVVCTDVLEHIEPECIDGVLDHLAELTRKVLYATVAIIPANKHLADGSNAHRIIEHPMWWLERFFARFHIKNYTIDETCSGFGVIAEPANKFTWKRGQR